MGYFDLPTGNLELRIDGEWKSVCFGDGLTVEHVHGFVVEWSKHHKVTGARYCGRTVPMPKGKLVFHYEKAADKMPDNCTSSECSFADRGLCPCDTFKVRNGEYVTKKCYRRRRHHGCPLTFVPFVEEGE